MKINVAASQQPFHIEITNALGMHFVVNLEDVELDLYGGEDGQEWMLRGRTIA